MDTADLKFQDALWRISACDEPMISAETVRFGPVSRRSLAH